MNSSSIVFCYCILVLFRFIIVVVVVVVVCDQIVQPPCSHGATNVARETWSEWRGIQDSNKIAARQTELIVSIIAIVVTSLEYELAIIGVTAEYPSE